jgi:hypothetical protein
MPPTERKRVEKVCTICGVPFLGVYQRNRTTVAYCSRACRDRAWRLAHGEERKRPTKGES